MRESKIRRASARQADGRAGGTGCADVAEVGQALSGDGVLGESADALSAGRVMGFCAYLSWMVVLFYTSSLYAGFDDYVHPLYMNYLVSILAYGGGMLVLAAALRMRMPRWLDRPAVAPVACAFMSAGTLLLTAAPWAGAESAALVVASGALTGLGSAPLFLSWAQRFSCAMPRTAFAELCLAWCGAAAVGLASLFAPLPLTSAVAVVLPVASCSLLRRGGSVLEPVDEGVVPESPGKRARGLFARAVVAALLFGAVASFAATVCDSRFAQVGPVYGILLLLGVALLSVGYFALAMLGVKRLIGIAYRSTMLLMSIGCLTLALAVPGNVWSNVLVFAGHASFMLLLLVMCVDAGAYYGLAPAVVAAVGYGALCAGEAVGTVAGLALDAWAVSFDALSLPVFACVLVTVLLVVHLCLLTEKGLDELCVGRLTDLNESELVRREQAELDGEAADGCAGDAAASPAGNGLPGSGAGGAPAAGELERAEKLARFGDRYGLTPREREVLDLLLRGRTVLRIQEELVISRGTANTHVHHIYQKCEVSGRQELYDLVEGFRA